MIDLQRALALDVFWQPYRRVLANKDTMNKDGQVRADRGIGLGAC